MSKNGVADNPNAWLMVLSNEVSLDGFVLSTKLSSTCINGIKTGDAIILTEELNGKFNIAGIAQRVTPIQLVVRSD